MAIFKKNDAKNNSLAIEMFEKSLQIKANNLGALVGLSKAYSHEVSKYNHSSTLLSKAISLAEQATHLYPKQPQTYNALGFAHDVKGDIKTALKYYRKSYELDPNSPSTLASLAFLYGLKGELLQSLELNLKTLNSDLEYKNLQVADNLNLLGFIEMANQWYQRADVLSPDNVFASSQRVRFLLSHMRYDEAQSLLTQAKHKGLNRPEIHTLQGIMSLINNNRHNAVSSFKTAQLINKEDFESQIWLLVLSNNIEDKAQKLESLWQKKEFHWPGDYIYKILVYASLGDRKKILKNLKIAYEQGFMDSQWLLQMPPVKPYLSDTEFLYWIDQIKQKADAQRQKLFIAQWLPKGFLDPARSYQ